VAWGASLSRSEGDIGLYGQGAKAAALYLGSGFDLLCKKAGEASMYRLIDTDLRDRTEAKDYGDLHPLSAADAPTDLPAIGLEHGYVRLRILDLDPTLQLTEEALRHDLSSVYGQLINSGDIDLRLNGTSVKARFIHLDPDLPTVPIRVRIDHLQVDGYVGKVLKGANRPAPKPGFTLYWNDRLIQEGVWFSFNPFAKGSLSGLFGELKVRGLTPNLNKTGFTESGSHRWTLFGEEVLRQAQPILDPLRSPSDPTKITLRDRRLAKQTRRELQGILDRLFGVEQITIKEERTVTITRGGGNQPTGARGENSTGEKRPTRKGKTEEVDARADIPQLPEVIVDAWSAPVRAETRKLPNGNIVIAVNKAHPGYAASNARYAIAESVIVEALRASGGFAGIDEFVNEADLVLAEWATANKVADDE
jgi:hypothetical protein